jgi:hypothetical protein
MLLIIVNVVLIVNGIKHCDQTGNTGGLAEFCPWVCLSQLRWVRPHMSLFWDLVTMARLCDIVTMALLCDLELALHDETVDKR